VKCHLKLHIDININISIGCTLAPPGKCVGSIRAGRYCSGLTCTILYANEARANRRSWRINFPAVRIKTRDSGITPKCNITPRRPTPPRPGNEISPGCDRLDVRPSVLPAGTARSLPGPSIQHVSPTTCLLASDNNPIVRPVSLVARCPDTCPPRPAPQTTIADICKKRAKIFCVHFFLSVYVYYVFFVMGGQLRWANAFTGSLPLLQLICICYV